MIKDVEAGSKEAEANGTNITQSAPPLQMDGAMSEELEDGELEEDVENGEMVMNGYSTQKSYVHLEPVKLARSPLTHN